MNDWFEINEFVCLQSVMTWLKTSTILGYKQDLKEKKNPDILCLFLVFLLSQELFPLCTRCDPLQNYRAAEKAFQIWRLKGGNTVLTITCLYKQSISSSFWCQLDVENNLSAHITNWKYARACFGNFGKLKSDLRLLKPWFMVPECVGLLMESKSWPLKHERQVTSGGTLWWDISCLYSILETQYVCMGERGVPILYILFNTLISSKALVSTSPLPHHPSSM